jgi:hypothetical protein
MKREIETLLNERLRELFLEEMNADERNDHQTKKLIAHKRRYLSRLATSRLMIFPELSVFISFSESGKRLGEQAVQVCKTLGITAKTGFDDEVQARQNVLSAVKETINSCSLFLGIWTPEYQLIDNSNPPRARAAPSVWMLEEKGMAQAFNKPFRLLVEETIHNDFWLKTTPDKLQHSFDKSNFESKLRRAIEALVRRYHERHVAIPIYDDNEIE